MRKYARLDANHKDIVNVLKQCGCTVLSLASVGNGCPDLLIARNGKMALIEVKDGNKPPSERRLTPMEGEFIKNWNAPVYIVKNTDEALMVVLQFWQPEPIRAP